MLKKLKIEMNSRNATFLAVIAISLAPAIVFADTASVGQNHFVSTALGNKDVKVIIQLAAGIAAALQTGSLIQSFLTGQAANWLQSAIGIAVATVIAVDPGTLSSTLSSIGL